MVAPLVAAAILGSGLFGLFKHKNALDQYDRSNSYYNEQARLVENKGKALQSTQRSLLASQGLDIIGTAEDIVKETENITKREVSNILDQKGETPGLFDLLLGSLSFGVDLTSSINQFQKFIESNPIDNKSKNKSNF